MAHGDRPSGTGGFWDVKATHQPGSLPAPPPRGGSQALFPQLWSAERWPGHTHYPSKWVNSNLSKTQQARKKQEEPRHPVQALAARVGHRAAMHVVHETWRRGLDPASGCSGGGAVQTGLRTAGCCRGVLGLRASGVGHAKGRDAPHSVPGPGLWALPLSSQGHCRTEVPASTHSSGRERKKTVELGGTLGLNSDKKMPFQEA